MRAQRWRRSVWPWCCMFFLRKENGIIPVLCFHLLMLDQGRPLSLLGRTVAQLGGRGRWQRKNYCKWLAQWTVRGNVLITHVCCGLQTTFMNLPEIHWHTVCLCVFVCSIKTQQQECGSRGDISTTMEHKRNPYWLSELWKVCRFMLTYKQPGDWFAPVWSILAQVRMVVPVAVSSPATLYDRQRLFSEPV